MANSIYQFAGFRLDCDSFELRRNGTSLRIERMPMELLILLVSRQGQLVTREEIARPSRERRHWDCAGKATATLKMP